MKLFDFANDPVILLKIQTLDANIVANRNEEYSQWTQFVDHKQTPFALADFVYANLQDTLPTLANNTLEILWISCCSNHDLYAQIMRMSNAFLERRHPDLTNLLRVELAQFIQEVAETMQLEMGEEAAIQKKQFKNYLEYDPDIVLQGEVILQAFRKKIHVLYYLPDCNVAIPFFIQVQPNFKDLSTYSIVRHVCRNIVAIDKEPPDVYDWLHVLEFVRARGIQPYSLSGNIHSMNARDDWPGFLTLFYDLFPDKSVTIEERFLQLLTIYHTRWDKIFTLSGWRINRAETQIILDFLHDYPKPFYQKRYVDELFHLIV